MQQLAPHHQGFGNGDEVVGGSFPGGPAGPPVSYGPVMTANGGFGMAGPCQCPGPFVPQGPGGCGGSCQFAGPGVCAGPGGCAGPGVPLGPTVSQVPAPFLAMEYVMELGCPPAVEDSSRWECRVVAVDMV